MNRFTASLALLSGISFFVLPPLLLSGCSESTADVGETDKVVFVDLNKVAECHPSWKQAIDNADLGQEMMKPMSFSCPAIPDATVTKCRHSDFNLIADENISVVEEANNRELESFEALHRAEAESWIQSHSEDIYESCRAEDDDEKLKCAADLSRKLHAISEKYAAKTLPLQLKIAILEKSRENNPTVETPNVYRPDLTKNLSELKNQLDAIYQERDREWSIILESAKRNQEAINQASSLKARKKIDDLRSQAMAQVDKKLSEKRLALSNDSCISGKIMTCQPSDCWMSENPILRCPEAIKQRKRVSAESEKLLATERPLQSAALKDAAAFVEAWAKVRGEKIVFDYTKGKNIRDLTQEYASEFYRRFSPSR